LTSLTGGQWVLICLAAFLIGVSKTGIAGLGILAIAIFASVLPARESVGAVLIALIAGDMVAVLSYRHDATWHHLWRLFPWAGLGVVIGALALGRIPDAGVRRMIGGILLALIVFYLLRQYTSRNGDSELIPFTRHPWLIAVTGIAAGFTTMVANASGPIMVLYLLALRLPKVAFIGTAAWFFFFLNLFKVPFSAGLGLINTNSLAVGLRLAPFAMAGAFLGKPLLRHVNQKLFEQLALVLTLVAAIRLLLQDVWVR
jgi:uncharacterized protein